MQTTEGEGEGSCRTEQRRRGRVCITLIANICFALWLLSTDPDTMREGAGEEAGCLKISFERAKAVKMKNEEKPLRWNKRELRILRRREARLVKLKSHSRNLPPLPRSLGGKWLPMREYLMHKAKPDTAKLERIEREMKAKGNLYGVGLESTDEEELSRRIANSEAHKDPDRPFELNQPVALHNLSAASEWNGMKGIVMGYDGKNRVRVRIIHGEKKRLITRMSVPKDKLVSMNTYSVVQSSRIRKLQRLEQRFLRLKNVPYRVAVRMKTLWTKVSSDRTFHPEWYRNIIDFVENTPIGRLKIILWKKSRFKYSVPYPPGMQTPRSQNFTDRPPPKKIPKSGRWQKFHYFPSAEELGYPEWEVGQDIRVDVEGRSYFRHAKIVRIEQEPNVNEPTQNISYLIVNYWDPDAKSGFENKTARVLADHWSRLHNPRVSKYMPDEEDKKTKAEYERHLPKNQNWQASGSKSEATNDLLQEINCDEEIEEHSSILRDDMSEDEGDLPSSLSLTDG